MAGDPGADAGDSPVEAGVSRIRLINFGEQAVELELFTDVMTAEYAEFLEVRENLLLEIASLVEAAGSAFAQPTQYVYMDAESAPGAPVRPAVAPDDVRLGSPSPETPVISKAR